MSDGGSRLLEPAQVEQSHDLATATLTPTHRTDLKSNNLPQQTLSEPELHPVEGHLLKLYTGASTIEEIRQSIASTAPSELEANVIAYQEAIVRIEERLARRGLDLGDSATATTTTSMTLGDLIVSMNGAPDGDARYVADNIVALVLSHNPNLIPNAESIEPAKLKQIRIAAGTEINLSPPLGTLVRDLELRHVDLQLQAALEQGQDSASDHTLLDNGAALAEDLRNDVQTELRNNRVEHLLGLYERAKGATTAFAGLDYNDAYVQRDYIVGMDKRFADLHDLIAEIGEHPNYSEHAREMERDLTALQIDTYYKKAVALLQAGRGGTARGLLEGDRVIDGATVRECKGVLQLTQQLLDDPATEARQRGDIHKLRGSCYQFIGRSYLTDDGARKLTKMMQHPDATYDHPQVQELVQYQDKQIEKAFDKALNELHKSFEINPSEDRRTVLEGALSAQGAARAELYGSIGDARTQMESLKTYLLTLPAGASLIGPTKYLDEATAELCGGGYGSDYVYPVSDQTVADFVSRFKKLSPEGQRREFQKLEQLANCAINLMAEDSDYLSQAVSVRKLLHEAAYHLDSPTYKARAQIIDAQFAFSWRDSSIDSGFAKLIAAENTLGKLFIFNQDVEDEAEVLTQKLQSSELAPEEQKAAATRLNEIQLARAEYQAIQEQIFSVRLQGYLNRAEHGSNEQRAEAVQMVRAMRELTEEKAASHQTALNSQLKNITEQLSQAKQGSIESKNLVKLQQLTQLEISKSNDFSANLRLHEAFAHLNAGDGANARATLEGLVAEYGEEVPWVKEKVSGIIRDSDDGKLASGLQTLLHELNSESLLEFSVASIGLGGGGAAIGMVCGGPVGAGAGFVIGEGIAVVALKSRNVIRGWGRISNGFSDGLNNITWQQTVVDSGCLVLDTVGIVAPGVGFMKAGGRTGLRAAVAGDELAKATFLRTFSGEATRFGARTGTWVAGTTIAVPIADQIYQIESSNLSAVEKSAARIGLAADTAKMAIFIGLYAGTHSAIKRVTYGRASAGDLIDKLNTQAAESERIIADSAGESARASVKPTFELDLSALDRFSSSSQTAAEIVSRARGVVDEAGGRLSALMDSAKTTAEEVKPTDGRSRSTTETRPIYGEGTPRVEPTPGMYDRLGYVNEGPLRTLQNRVSDITQAGSDAFNRAREIADEAGARINDIIESVKDATEELRSQDAEIRPPAEVRPIYGEGTPRVEPTPGMFDRLGYVNEGPLRRETTDTPRLGTNRLTSTPPAAPRSDNTGSGTSTPPKPIPDGKTRLAKENPPPPAPGGGSGGTSEVKDLEAKPKRRGGASPKKPEGPQTQTKVNKDKDSGVAVMEPPTEKKSGGTNRISRHFDEATPTRTPRNPDSTPARPEARPKPRFTIPETTPRLPVRPRMTTPAVDTPAVKPTEPVQAPRTDRFKARPQRMPVEPTRGTEPAREVKPASDPVVTTPRPTSRPQTTTTPVTPRLIPARRPSTEQALDARTRQATDPRPAPQPRPQAEARLELTKPNRKASETRWRDFATDVEIRNSQRHTDIPPYELTGVSHFTDSEHHSGSTSTKKRRHKFSETELATWDKFGFGLGEGYWEQETGDS